MYHKNDKNLEELEEKILLYEEILDKVLEGIYITDTEDKVIWFNKTVELLDGVKKEEAIGKKQAQAWQYMELPASVTGYIIRTGKQSKEQLITYKDLHNKTISVFAQAYPFYYQNQLKAVYSLANYVEYSEKQLNKISEYRKRFLDSNARVVNNAPYTLYDVIGSSSAMIDLVSKARKVAINKTPVMLYGETGTGKEIFAQGIHNASLQHDGKFVAINCAAIPENLLESFLFGSVKGAYTGAVDKPGLLEDANGGTLFLDELNSMPLLLQGKLLRVFQEKQACRIGSNRPYPVNCRLISATNQDPRELIHDGILRTDLYFRLAVLTLEIPPLAKRDKDVLELTRFFINRYNSEYNLQIHSIDDDVEQLFLNYQWPGNVRELDNAIEYAMNFLSRGRAIIHQQDLPHYIQNAVNQSHCNSNTFESSQSEPKQRTLNEVLAETERHLVKKTLEETNWNISRAAKILGIHREALYYRIKKFGFLRPSQ